MCAEALANPVGLPDAELACHASTLAGHIESHGWPPAVVAALAQRAATAALEQATRATNAGRAEAVKLFLSIVWPCPATGSASTPAIGGVFDPAAPQVACALGPAQAAEFFMDFLVNSFLVTVMAKDTMAEVDLDCIEEVAILYHNMRGLSKLEEEAVRDCGGGGGSRDKLEKAFNTIETIMEAVLAIAGVAGLADAEAAMESVKAVTSARPGTGRMGMAAMLLENKPWRSKVKAYWAGLVALRTHGPKLERAEAVFRRAASAPAAADASAQAEAEAEVETTWEAAVAELPAWRQELPQGKLEGLQEAMLAWLTACLARLEAACGSTDTDITKMAACATTAVKLGTRCMAAAALFGQEQVAKTSERVAQLRIELTESQLRQTAAAALAALATEVSAESIAKAIEAALPAHPRGGHAAGCCRLLPRCQSCFPRPRGPSAKLPGAHGCHIYDL